MLVTKKKREANGNKVHKYESYKRNQLIAKIQATKRSSNHTSKLQDCSQLRKEQKRRQKHRKEASKKAGNLQEWLQTIRQKGNHKNAHN